MMVRERDLTGTIRKPIDKSVAQEVLAHIGEWNESVSDQWKVRASAQQEKLDNGNVFSLAEVYKTLSLRQEADCLSAADRRQLRQSEQCLSEELATALDQSVGQICQHMKKAALN